ncbi:DUF2254 domain-containing protein [Catellatospora chokoriensis]|uniref:DUF2254 domain-containing protein n=1 Tax=Catellatospora chokoriensis TaxID=310353 RepID=A0A8J3KBK3_9ACTN|nr:hypothetical protein Cch02nite_71670 [Catellatospora chokoriensis]
MLGIALPRADATLTAYLPEALIGHLFTGGPEAARTVLSVIAGSLITVTALTFSLTVVTLQLASSQFSPRLLRTFTRDPAVQATLALLLGTFTYAVMVLRTIRSDTATQSGFVPQLSVTLAFLLGLTSVVALIGFLAHVVGQIRIERLLQRVADDTAATARRMLQHQQRDCPPSAVSPDAKPVTAQRTGFLTAVDDRALLAAAVDAAMVIRFDCHVGDWLVQATPFAHAWPLAPAAAADQAADQRLATNLDAALTIGPERTTDQDVSFGLRQLTDVAVRALSPGINDPTTAVHALAHASAILCDLATHRPSPRLLHDQDERVRVIIAQPDLPDLLELVVAQPGRYGAAEPAIQARLLALLREVAWCATDLPTHTAVRAQLDQIHDTVARQQHYTVAEQARLRRLSGQVHAALGGRWEPDPEAGDQTGG